jgi:hypothetical protein
MTKILTGLLIWTVASFILAPFIGRFLKRRLRVPANHNYPLPEGSILGKHSERVSQ